MRTRELSPTFLVAFLIVFTLASPVSSQTAVPMLLNYQGELRSPTTGEALADGSYNMVFRIYDAESDGVQLWQGVHSDINGNPVHVANGIFSIILGSGAGNALDASVFDGADRWLEIRVGLETLSPRQRITSVGYAIVSEDSRLLSGREASEFADRMHAHSGGEITSGTVSEARIDPSIARDSEQTVAIAAHTAIADAHHARYTEAEAVAAMGAKANSNPLNHDRTTSLAWTNITSIPAGFADGVDNDSGSTSWFLTGNAGISGTNFLGTTDSRSLQLRVNNTPALVLQPTASSPNIIAGNEYNEVRGAAVGATIGGGGSADGNNVVTDSYGTVSGGRSNMAGDDVGTADDAPYSTVSGGFMNSASASAATVGGGFSIAASGDYATVGGGRKNAAIGEDATIGGGHGNQATADCATIAGGGRSDEADPDTANRVTDNYGTVGGGGNNQAGDNAGTAENRKYATVAGGYHNIASGSCATVGGGKYNEATAESAAVGGGGFNAASGSYATVGGGQSNEAAGEFATVSGGLLNSVNGIYATTGGGTWNKVNADFGTIAGGGCSDESNHDTGNRVTDDYGTVGGGGNNQAGNDDADSTNRTYATVSGGLGNTASGGFSAIGGGLANVASGGYCVVPGGYMNAAGQNYSFAAGTRAQAGHNGAFVWADSSSTLLPFGSTAANEFSARATGGVRFVSAINVSTGQPTAGVKLSAGGGSWSSISDRALKENVSTVDGKGVLEKLAALPVAEWNYIAQDPSIRHMGPMAQDFYAAFGLGEDDKHIATVDADGVALAAIQGLHEIVEEKQDRISTLEERNADLEARLAALEALVETLVKERKDGKQ